MAVLNAEVLDAFLAAGVPEDKARKAAEALAGHEQRFAKIEQDQAVGFEKLSREISELRSDVKGELTLIKWIGGVIVAGVAALIARGMFA